MKDKIIQCIQTAKTSMSLSEILDFLQHSVSERTLRRELQRLVGLGLIIKLGDKRGTRYALKLLDARLETTCFTDTSKMALNYILLAH